MRRSRPPHQHHPIGARSRRGIVGDQEQRGSARRPPGEQQIRHRFPSHRIEASRWLVGQHGGGILGQRARLRDPLLIAARKRRRPIPAPPGQTDLVERGTRPRAGLRGGHASKLERDRHVLFRHQRGHKMKGLKDQAEPAAAHARAPLLAEAAEILPHDQHAS